MPSGCSRRPWWQSGGPGGRIGGARGVAVWIAAWLSFTACAGTTDPWADPAGVQLALPGDHRCSDPAWGELAGQCCAAHDAAYWAGGTESDRQVADHEFGACMALWGVPPNVVDLRVWAVRRWGGSSFRYLTHRTRGPP